MNVRSVSFWCCSVRMITVRATVIPVNRKAIPNYLTKLIHGKVLTIVPSWASKNEPGWAGLSSVAIA